MNIRSEVTIELSAADLREAIMDLLKKKAPAVEVAPSEIIEDPAAEAGWRITFVNDRINPDDLSEFVR